MAAITPPLRPRLARSAIEKHVQAAREAAVKLSGQKDVTAQSFPVVLVGIRGYYRDTMGKPGVNDRGIYDDALFLVSDHGCVAFNANTDPSVYRKSIAVLRPGCYLYKLGIHGLSKPAAQRYRALVQASAVTVERDGVGAESGFFGINIHRGGNTTTSSLGCQTVPPAQWAAFIALVEAELKRAGQKELPYCLTENPAA